MDQSVKILIDAEDAASAKIEAASKAIESNIRNIKDVGGKAKASTEFISVIANVAGNSQLGALAGQLGQVTEKVGQFSEVQKLGGAGATAFKAGLAGLVGVMAFSFGKAIGDSIFGTEKWTKALGEANQAAAKLAGEVTKMGEKKFSADMQEIELIKDPEAKQQAYTKLLGDLEKNIMGVQSVVRSGEKEVAAWDAAWFKTGNRAAFADQAKEKLAQDRERLDVMEAQAQQLREMTTGRQREIELMKEKAAIESKSSNFVAGLKEEYELQLKIFEARKNASVIAPELDLSGMRSEIESIKPGVLDVDVSGIRSAIDSIKSESLKVNIGTEEADLSGIASAIEAMKSEAAALASAEDKAKLDFKIEKTTVGDDREEAAALSEKIAQLKELANIEAEARKAEAQRLEEAKKLATAREDEIQKLEQGLLVMEKGAIVAEEMRRAKELESLGFSEVEAQKISQLEGQKIDSGKEKTLQDTPDLMATESRILSGRGSNFDKSGDDPQKAVVDETIEMKNALLELISELRGKPQGNQVVFEGVN